MALTCDLCSKAYKWLDANSKTYECSHVDCECRKQVMTLGSLVAYYCDEHDPRVIGYKSVPTNTEE
jgi:hypothetical protein